MSETAELSAHLASLGRVLLGYSGGVDSTFLAVVASQSIPAGDFLAVLGVSPSLGEAQHAHARQVAGAHGIPLLELPTNEMADPDYQANRLDRCYHCKRTLWQAVHDVAAADGWLAIIDGTNADDLHEHRPGFRAGHEARVRSPLAELGWTKSGIRAASRALGIEAWDAPAAPCLASRLTPHLAVTSARLRQVGDAESYLRSLGVQGDLRVRHLGTTARIEVLQDQFRTVDAHWPKITARMLALGFDDVARDPSGYRRGALTVMASR